MALMSHTGEGRPTQGDLRWLSVGQHGLGKCCLSLNWALGSEYQKSPKFTV